MYIVKIFYRKLYKSGTFSLSYTLANVWGSSFEPKFGIYRNCNIFFIPVLKSYYKYWSLKKYGE